MNSFPSCSNDAVLGVTGLNASFFWYRQKRFRLETVKLLKYTNLYDKHPLIN